MAKKLKTTWIVAKLDRLSLNARAKPPERGIPDPDARCASGVL